MSEKEWEMIVDNGWAGKTERLQVPGGYLYRDLVREQYYDRSEHYFVNIVFVPTVMDIHT